MNKTTRKNMLTPYDEYGPLCHSFNVLYDAVGPCEDTFFDQYIKAIEESGVDPKQFAKNNKIDFKKIFEFYDETWVEPAGHNHDVESYKHLIVGASNVVKFCDFLGIKIKTKKSPNRLSVAGHPFFEEDFEEAFLSSSKEDRNNFARLFSTKPKNWFKHWPLQDCK